MAGATLVPTDMGSVAHRRLPLECGSQEHTARAWARQGAPEPHSLGMALCQTCVGCWNLLEQELEELREPIQAQATVLRTHLEP